VAGRRKLQGADCDWVQLWQKVNAKPFEHIVLKTKTVVAEATV
jgi:dihydrolipoamide dehydrogenase